MRMRRYLHWQKIASRASGGGAYLETAALEIFIALMLDRHYARKAGNAVSTPAALHRAARMLARQ